MLFWGKYGHWLGGWDGIGKIALFGTTHTFPNRAFRPPCRPCRSGQPGGTPHRTSFSCRTIHWQNHPLPAAVITNAFPRWRQPGWCWAVAGRVSDTLADQGGISSASGTVSGGHCLAGPNLSFSQQQGPEKSLKNRTREWSLPFARQNTRHLSGRSMLGRRSGRRFHGFLAVATAPGQILFIFFLLCLTPQVGLSIIPAEGHSQVDPGG